MAKKEEKTEKVQQEQHYKMLAKNGVTFYFEAAGYEAAQEWSRKQLEALGLVYPRDLSELSEVL